MATDPELLERFWSKVDRGGPGGCWVWLPPAHTSGYAKFFVGGRAVYAHRWSYETFRGRIPSGLQIDHLCCCRICVNPAHLEPVTQAENIRRAQMRRGEGAYANRCLNGHEFTDANTLVSSKGHRTCRACARARRRSRRQVPSDWACLHCGTPIDPDRPLGAKYCDDKTCGETFRRGRREAS